MTLLENFTPLSSFSGGLLIGLAATLLLLFNGRIAGISGIMSGLISPGKGEIFWRLVFLLGLVLGALLVKAVIPDSIKIREGFPYGLLAIGGFLVGFGTRMANGCTSGHAVCGIARLSKRSIAATLTFIVSGMMTVYLLRHLIGLSV
ncbi:YeeE/YedE family protein [Methylicorpusculum sp.]|uniref:YeeE/YedE family protein n=1 Tax=Methylicorpusculum sp. TaxID=2713644 RepID=UPI00351DD7F6